MCTTTDRSQINAGITDTALRAAYLIGISHDAGKIHLYDQIELFLQ